MAAREYRPRKPGWRQFTASGGLRCQATSRTRKTAGQQCGSPARPGLTVCGTHGGNSPASKAKSERVRREAKLAASVRRFGLRRDVSPAEALLEEVQHLSGECAWLREVIDRDLLQGDDPRGDGEAAQDWRALSWGPSSKTVTTQENGGKGDSPGRSFTSTSETATASMHPLWLTYEKTQDRLVKAAAAAMAAGVAERQVRLAESQGLLVAQAVRGILAGMLAGLRERGLSAELDAAWPQLVGAIVPTHLRELSAATESS